MEETGFKKALNAALTKLPEILTSVIVALSVFSFGLWIDVRDLKTNSIECKDNLCQNILECSAEVKLQDALSEYHANINRIDNNFLNHTKEDEQWQKVILQTQTRLYKLISDPTSRPDPFTGAEGKELWSRVRELDSRIEKLEKK